MSSGLVIRRPAWTFSALKPVLLLIVAAASVASCPALGQSFDSLQINDTGNCNVTRTGSLNRDIIFKGHKEYGRMCQAVVDIAVFEETYRYCALAGITGFRSGDTCSFQYYDQNQTKVEFASSPGLTCTFTCLKK